MPWVIDFHPIAQVELLSAERWYRVKSDRAANEFVRQVDRALERIAVSPDSLPEIGRDYRRTTVRKFPFQLVFRILDSSRIRILAVAHFSRRPDYWRRRQ